MSEGYTVAQAYVQIMPSTKNFGSTLKGELGNSTEEAGREGGNRFASGLQTGLKVAGAALAAATGGAVKLSKEVVGAYGEYEQLVGGVQKIFGEMDYEAVVENASGAFKTAGLSANDYMETVTGFSASLISSLDGNTRKAVEYADMAITDMSDNANTFGTDMEAIQMAYQGFSKQNYTMLDNLKLGYGGTKTEMERLITDAEQLDSSFQAARDTNGSLTLSYADVVDAIHIVQENMGIAGTTAKEAATTIQGSIDTMKGAWENLLTGMGDSNADIGKLTQDFVESFETVINNIEPVIQNISEALPEVLGAVIDAAADILPDLIVNLIPAVVSGLTRLAAGLVTHLPEIVTGIVEGLVDGISQALTGEKTGWFDSLLGEYEDIIDEMASRNETLAKSISGTKEAYDAQLASAQANAGVAKELWGELQTLIGAEDQSAEQKARIRDLVSELNELIPGLGLAYDELTGKINLTDEEMQRHIDLMLLEAQQEAANEMYIQSIKDKMQAQKDYEQACNDFDGVLKQLKISEENWTQAMSDGQITKGEIFDMLVQGGTSVVEAWWKLDEVSEEVGQAYDNMSEAGQNWADAAANEKEAAGSLTETYEKLHSAGQEMANDLGTRFSTTFGQEMPAALDSAIEAASSAGYQIPTSLISGLESGNLGIGDAIDRMNALVDFNAAIETAGIGGTEVSQSFVNSWLAGEIGVTEANNYLLSLIDFTNAINNASESGVELTAELVNGMISEAGLSGVVSAAEVIADAAKPTIVANEFQEVGAAVPTNVATGVENGAGQAVAAAGQLASDIAGEFTGLPGEMNTSGSNAGSNLNTGFGSWTGTVSGTVDEMYNFFYNTLGTALPPLMSTWGSNSGQKFNSGLNLWSADVQSTAQSMNQDVTTALQGLPAMLQSVGSQAGSGLYNGLAGWQSAISSMAWSIANSINTAARQALKIKSPSKAMEEVGDLSVEGLYIRLDAGKPKVVGAMEQMASEVIASADHMVNSLNDAVMDSAIDGTMNLGSMIQETLGAGPDPRGLERREQAESDSLDDYLQQIYEMLERISRMKVVMDSGELVGVIAPKMNEEFEAISQKERRG